MAGIDKSYRYLTNGSVVIYLATFVGGETETIGHVLFAVGI